MHVIRSLLLSALLASVGEAARTGCPCLAKPATGATQTAATGKPAYVTGTEYGWTCKTHDKNQLVPASDTANAAYNCADNTTDKVGDGKANDWCLDEWCIVDKDNCDVKVRPVTYSARTDDYFAYEACQTASWLGNGWVGRCKCLENRDSYCWCGSDAALAPGVLTGCPCLATPATPALRKQANATGKPAFVGTVDGYGWGCGLHDKGEDVCGSDPAAKLADGEGNDWCLDRWCIVDKDNCDHKVREVTYTVAATDYFSYEACEANFTGNGWVGRCACADKANSKCTCAAGATSAPGGAAGTTTVAATTADDDSAASALSMLLASIVSMAAVAIASR